jgi:hypothetical protein
MKIYKVSYRNNFSEHTGYEYFSNKKDAKREQEKNNKGNQSTDDVAELELILTKRGVLAFLNAYASYPDNG